MMLKILNRYILTQFLKPFVITFKVTLFFFILQFLWVWVDELIGKGLNFLIVMKLIMFLAATLVPKALPISILLAAIMTLGGWGERSELAASKAAGLSILRLTRPLMVLTLALSFGVFFFANNVIPYSEYKFRNILKNIHKRKPSISINANEFNAMGTFVIKVGEKLEDSLKDVTIYQLDENKDKIMASVIAETGKILSSSDENFIIFDLYHGVRKQEIEAKDRREQKIKQPFVDTEFQRYTIHLNVSDYNSEDLEQEKLKNFYTMLNVSQLNVQIKKLDSQYVQYVDQFSERNQSSIPMIREQTKYDHYMSKDSLTKEETLYITQQQETHNKVAQSTYWPQSAMTIDSLDNLPHTVRIRLSTELKAKARETKNNIYRIENMRRQVAKHLMAKHKKFSFASVLFVFLMTGLALGAIIRKGGLGIPIIIGVVVYMLYYVMYIVFKRMAEELVIEPILASWFPVLILTPIGLWLIVKSNADSQVFKTDWYFNLLRKIKQYAKQRKNGTKISS